jgi:predicted  nucleic acid-binding Zn-ribbon protein
MPNARCANCGRWFTPDENGTACPNCGSADRVVFARDEAVAEDRSSVARELAWKHYEAEEGLQRVIRLESSHEAEGRSAEPIKLLEVNANTIPSGILPVSFGPAPASGIPYPSIIVEVSPEEFERIQSQELKLPRGWQLGEELPRPSAVAEGR